ncbi:MAG TPA: HlyD family efflux transporter periplasmic adaptor subunit [Anaerolineales bacterium]|nr:HlyD family efflux transporter periplasmic adaptor subunit [Anaerolineales bacterium]
MNHKLFITLILASLLFTACAPAGNAPTATPEATAAVIADSTIIAEGRLEPVRYAEIAFTASGRISDIPVAEGQTVKQGQELIRLGDASDTQFAAAQLELVSAKKALTDLTNSAGTDFAQAVIDLKDAQEEYDKAVDYLDYLQNADKVPQTETRSFLVQTWRGYEYRTKTKHFKGPAPEDWIIEAKNDLALEKAELDAAQRAYDRLKGGADAEQLAVLEARLEAAEAGVAAFSVIAPFDGVVANLNAKLGGSINAGEPAVTVADFSQWLVQTTDLTEIDVVNLEEGQPVTVTLDAIPEAQLTGEILSIGQTFAENQGDIVYEVTILLTDTHPAMRWGMTAAVTFDEE